MKEEKSNEFLINRLTEYYKKKKKEILISEILSILLLSILSPSKFINSKVKSSTGILWCELINHLFPNSIQKIYKNNLSITKIENNFKEYITIAKIKFNFDDSVICTVSDFMEKKSSKQVLMHYFYLYHSILNNFKELSFPNISENFEDFFLNCTTQKDTIDLNYNLKSNSNIINLTDSNAIQTPDKDTSSIFRSSFIEQTNNSLELLNITDKYNLLKDLSEKCLMLLQDLNLKIELFNKDNTKKYLEKIFHLSAEISDKCSNILSEIVSSTIKLKSEGVNLNLNASKLNQPKKQFVEFLNNNSSKKQIASIIKKNNLIASKSMRRLTDLGFRFMIDEEIENTLEARKTDKSCQCSLNPGNNSIEVQAEFAEFGDDSNDNDDDDSDNNSNSHNILTNKKEIKEEELKVNLNDPNQLIDNELNNPNKLAVDLKSRKNSQTIVTNNEANRIGKKKLKSINSQLILSINPKESMNNLGLSSTSLKLERQSSGLLYYSPRNWKIMQRKLEESSKEIILLQKKLHKYNFLKEKYYILRHKSTNTKETNLISKNRNILISQLKEENTKLKQYISTLLLNCQSIIKETKKVSQENMTNNKTISKLRNSNSKLNM